MADGEGIDMLSSFCHRNGYNSCYEGGMQIMINNERKLRNRIQCMEDELLRTKNIQLAESYRYTLMDLRKDLQKLQRSKRS